MSVVSKSSYLTLLLTAVLCNPLAPPVVADPLSLTIGGEKREFNWFPEDHLYGTYIADPLRATFNAQPLYYSRSDIIDTGRRRFDLNIGGSLGIARLHPQNDPQRGAELVLEVGFRGQFDPDHSEDNVGWDGIYALYLDYRYNKQWAYRLGVHHTSAHIGDEYAERTGRKRVNYTRQEIKAGVFWSFAKHWQTYVEAARANDLRNKVLQDHGRAEWGLQYDHPTFFKPFLGGYAAIDLSAYEENDWDINTTLQIGISWLRSERRWRFGLEYYDGRSQLGEFFQDQERYTGLGLWLDI